MAMVGKSQLIFLLLLFSIAPQFSISRPLNGWFDTDLQAIDPSINVALPRGGQRIPPLVDSINPVDGSLCSFGTAVNSPPLTLSKQNLVVRKQTAPLLCNLLARGKMPPAPSGPSQGINDKHS